MAKYPAGVLDTCAYLDLGTLNPDDLPEFPEITSVTMAELQQGVAMAKDLTERAVRAEQLEAAAADFDALPFDETAAMRYGVLVALVIDAGRNPRPRRMDLMIAAIASAWRLPLFTRNPDDFSGLERALTVVAV